MNSIRPVFRKAMVMRKPFVHQMERNKILTNMLFETREKNKILTSMLSEMRDRKTIKVDITSPSIVLLGFCTGWFTGLAMHWYR